LQLTVDSVLLDVVSSLILVASATADIVWCCCSVGTASECSGGCAVGPSPFALFKRTNEWFDRRKHAITDRTTEVG
jgi:hypothetical protein